MFISKAAGLTLSLVFLVALSAHAFSPQEWSLYADTPQVERLAQDYKELVLSESKEGRTELEQLAIDILYENNLLQEWEAFNLLVKAESGWNPRAVNPTSGACFLPQALPCSKLDTYGDRHDPEVQLRWMVDYIISRYGSVESAWSYHQINNWY